MKSQDLSIYKVTNCSTSRVYVGMLNSYIESLDEVKAQLNEGKYRNAHLQHSWSRFGSDIFAFEILDTKVKTEKLARKKIDKLMNFYIDADLSYNTVPDTSE